MKKLSTMNERNAPARWRVLMASTAIMALTGGSAWAAGAQGDQGSRSEYSTGAPSSERAPAGPAHGAPEPSATTGAGAGSVLQGTLYDMTAEELTGKAVVDPQGETIGEVEDLVTGGPDNRVHAVISVGGLLGVGGTQVVVPLDELQLQNDQLTVLESKDQLKSRPEYKEENYVRIEQKDRPIADFAAFESPRSQQSQPSGQPGTGEQTEPSEQPQEQGIEKEGESRY